MSNYNYNERECNREKKQRTETKSLAKMFKSDNYTRSNREMSNFVITISEKSN